MYHAAKASRLTAGFGSTTSSADTELYSSLVALRSRSRQLVRDAAYAKRAKVIVINNVIGSGIGLQAQVMTTRDELNDRVNDDIELQWSRWCKAKNCHTGGTLTFADLERAAMGQVFEAGEVFIRKHYERFGASAVPFALEMIEAERIADLQVNQATPRPAPNAFIRMGIEVDVYGRPLAYWIRNRHPGELTMQIGEQTERVERVPADQIIHLRLVDRWPQTRGEPWLHSVIRKLNDMDGYSEAEIVAARGAACYMATIQSPEDLASPPTDTETAKTGPEITLEPGTSQRLGPGETLNFISPNRPNAAMDPFMRMMLREVAAGAQVSYESLSRDYSQSNYSSSRLALLDDRDLWRMLQLWFVRAFREELYAEWLQQAVYARAIESIPVAQYAADPEKFAEAVRFKPRGWSWIDPTKEVEALEKAVLDGFTTVSDVIAQTGGGQDIEDVLKTRARELALMKAQGLSFATDPAAIAPKAAAAPAEQPEEPNQQASQQQGGGNSNGEGRVIAIGGRA